jgi:hypothetical protein
MTRQQLFDLITHFSLLPLPGEDGCGAKFSGYESVFIHDKDHACRYVMQQQYCSSFFADDDPYLILFL